jgi:hypothetical protein
MKDNCIEEYIYIFFSKCVIEKRCIRKKKRIPGWSPMESGSCYLWHVSGIFLLDVLVSILQLSSNFRTLVFDAEKIVKL